MSGKPAGEPTLADVQEQYPQWRCARGSGSATGCSSLDTCPETTHGQKPGTPTDIGTERQ